MLTLRKTANINNLVLWNMISELLATTFEFAVPKTYNKIKIKITVSNNQSRTTKDDKNFKILMHWLFHMNGTSVTKPTRFWGRPSYKPHLFVWDYFHPDKRRPSRANARQSKYQAMALGALCFYLQYSISFHSPLTQ